MVDSKVKIGVLGANRPLINFYRRAKYLGYEIHAFAWEEGAVCRSLADYFYPISFTEVDAIVRVCREQGIKMVTSFSLESALPSVYKISESMGWFFPSIGCMQGSMNKLTMRELFRKHGLLVPEFIDTDNASVEVKKFPLIVKPIDSGGSRGVCKVIEASDLFSAIERAKSYSGQNRVLIEQYIDGPEYSIETISQNGEHYIVAITEKVTSGPPNFVELAHFQPAILKDNELNQITNLVKNALTVLDHSQGPSHTEVKFDRDGRCYIIEIGLRLGGDFITSDLVRLSTGYDLVEASIEQALGRFVAPTNNLGKFAGVYFKTFQTIGVWDVMDNLKSQEFFIESDEWSNDINALTESSDRSGYMIYQHSERLKLNGIF